MLPSIFETCIPRPEIEGGELLVDLFAAALRSVVEGTAPRVYGSADAFFANTFPTDGIKTLIREVFGRLADGSGSPIVRLETSFGGGKTHDLIALWHICRNGRSIAALDHFTDPNLIPSGPIAVAAVDGKDLDPENGTFHADTGLTTFTLWGEIAYQIGGVEGYQLLQGSDRSGISPGTSVLERLIGDRSTVIVLDEIARYLTAAKAKKVGDSDLSKQVIAFLFTLMGLASSVSNLVFVYSLAATSDTFGEETTNLRELLQASARQERILTPATDVEIYNIVKRRIFERVDDNAANAAASEYFQLYRSARLNLPDACKDVQYRLALAASYPFHPELFQLLTKKIASIANFQRTRGALRLFARIVRYLWLHERGKTWIPLVHTHHLPVGIDADITGDLTSRLGRPGLLPAIEADIYNPTGRKAYAQTQDSDWLAADKPPFSSWVARTIFLHSLTQGNTAGIRRAELNLSCLTPTLEGDFVEGALERLSAVAWYLDDDPVTSLSRFKEEPSINKIRLVGK